MGTRRQRRAGGGQFLQCRSAERAAHRPYRVGRSDLCGAGGRGGYFDSQVVYIAERKGQPQEALAIMDQDGANSQMLSSGNALTLTPRFSRDYAMRRMRLR